jgi:hypothetical protein
MDRTEATDLKIGDVFADAVGETWRVLDIGRFMYVPGRCGVGEVPAYVSNTCVEYCIDTTNLPYCFFIPERRAYMSMNVSPACVPVIMWAVLLKEERIKKEPL